MDWGDVYRSHHYSPIYWGSFVSLINLEFPALKSTSSRHGAEQNQLGEEPEKEGPTEITSEDNKQPENEDVNTEQVVLEFDPRGTLYSRSQVTDYVNRGHELEDYNVLDYFVGTYDKSMRHRSGETAHTSKPMDPPGESEDSHISPRGRPSHHRVAYLETHPGHDSHIRVVRPPEHNNLPNLIGPRFPRRADTSHADFYAASVLTLLKPWRSLRDLKQPSQTWQQALEAFLGSASCRIHDIVSSIEHYHTCKSAAEDGTKSTSNVIEADEDEDESMTPCNEDASAERPRVLTNANVTLEMIAEAKEKASIGRDAKYGIEAVDIGYLKGIFETNAEPIRPSARRGVENDIATLKQWKTLLQKVPDTSDEANDSNETEVGAVDRDQGDVTRIDSTSASSSTTRSTVVPLLSAQESLDPASYDQLFPEQRRAFDIIRDHLVQSLNAATDDRIKPPPQLLMLLVGEGGTGKSKVIQTVTSEFERRGVPQLLVKSTYTGIAASLIDGRTTHRIGCISVRGSGLKDKDKAKLEQDWKFTQFLIVDECSMLSKCFFAVLSRHITTAKLAYNKGVSDLPFGGVNVILCGDAHQFPPVAGGPKSALYHPGEPGEPESDMSTGHEIYLKFQKVVILRRQVRVSDPVWREFLSCLRIGCVRKDHITMLRSLVLTHPTCVATDFQSEHWKDAPLITPRHSVRVRWNDAAVARHCRQTGNQLFICPAYDTIHRRPLTLLERYVSIKAQSEKSERHRNQKNGLPDDVPLAIGMNIMVTLNIDPDLDVANGTRGTIVDIVLDPNEPEYDSAAPTVTLQRLPLYILVKLPRTRAITLPGLEPGVLPITPASKNYQIVMNVKRGRDVVRVQRNVRRLQFPITPAYAFTDYRSQGQTIKAAIIDIATPPCGSPLTLFNIYVALSRSSGRDTIRLLRDFDEDLLLQPLDPVLANEDKRLEERDQETKAESEKKFVLGP